MSSATQMARMETDCSLKKYLGETFQVVSARLQIIDINDRCFLHLPLDVQGECSEWIKLAAANFQDSLGHKSARSPRLSLH